MVALANEITDITGGWVSPDYDDAGNLIYGPQSGDETTGLHFVRDAWNRQVAVYEDTDDDGVYEPAGPDTLIGEYEFDGTNRRIEKVLSATHAHYYYNHNWQLLEERFVDGQGATLSTNQHVFSARYIDSPIVWLHDGNGDGDLLDVGDLIRYYLSDANHNTTAVFDSATGAVVNYYVYSAYGTHMVYDSNWANPTAPTADGIMYSGYWLDIETGNYQVRAREYITSLSTFDVRDPIGYDAGDANLYRYVGNRPTIATDPLGERDTIIGATPRVYGYTIANVKPPPKCVPDDPKNPNSSYTLTPGTLITEKIVVVDKTTYIIRSDDGTVRTWECQRTAAGKKRTLAHEHGHIASRTAEVAALNKQYAGKYSSKLACEKALAQWVSDYKAFSKLESDHLNPAPCPRTTNDPYKEFNESQQAGLCTLKKTEKAK